MLLALCLLSLGISDCGTPTIGLNVVPCLVNSISGGCDCYRPDGTIERLSLLQCDKFVAFSPTDSEKINKYIIDLQKDLETCRSGALE